MKRYIFPILFAGLTLACTEDDLVRYNQDKDGLQFYAGNNSVLVGNDVSALERGLDFTNLTYEAKKPGDKQEQTYYYGDSIASFTYENIYMQLQGFPSPDERPYKLKVVKLEEEESDFLPEVVFEPFYSVYPNSTLDTIRFTIMRPQKDGIFMRGTYRFGIAIDTEDNPFFEDGVTEQKVLKVSIRDVYEKPAFWDERKEWLGEFDQEKYAFMLTYSQLPFTRNDEKMRERTDEYNQELIAYLNEHPEIAERFATPLPDMPKMVWWDANTDLLGEYSHEKFEFMQEVLEGEPLQNNDKLLYWNLRFREAAEGTEFEFPKNEKMASWWNNQALGDFTTEKQEYVIKCIFETCRLNNVPGDAWEYVPSVLRLEMDEYTTSNPTFPLDEEEPTWWNVRKELFGDFSPAKRDMVIKVVFELNRQAPLYTPSVSQLKDEYSPNSLFTRHVDYVGQYIEDYNNRHPKLEPMTLPEPAWWDNTTLGDYSKEKLDFIKQVMAKWNYSPMASTPFNEWNPIFRYELAIESTEHDFDFPQLNEAQIKPAYWDNYKYLGEFSESKFVFTWTNIMQYLKTIHYDGMPIDEFMLAGQWVFDTQEDAYNYLTNCYKTGYDSFMTRYAASAEAFTFPESFPKN